jgi:DNA-binding Xre family transcriptional regulator
MYMLRNKRGKLTPAESSIVLDLRPILVARNITNPLTFLLKMGIVNNSAIKMLKGEAVQINFNQLTKLCLNLNCTPNDLFALRKMTLSINHQLHQIREIEKEIINPYDAYKAMSLQEIEGMKSEE